jgi:hypothetical protein
MSPSPDDIWKKNINKMKSCTQVWKTRNLTFKGKTLIVKNFLLAQMGYETEMRGYEIHDMLVNLGRFPLNLPINNPFVFS